MAHTQSELTLSLRLALLALSLIPTPHHIQEPVKGPERQSSGAEAHQQDQPNSACFRHGVWVSGQAC